MSEWNKVTLGEITDWFSGGTPAKSNEDFWNGDIPWATAKSLVKATISDAEIKITSKGLDAGSRIAKVNDILLLVRGSGLYNDIPISIVTAPIAFNQDIKALRIKKNVDIEPDYLLYWLIANKRKLNSILESTGIGAGKFDTNVIKSIEIQIPLKLERQEIIKTAYCIYTKIDNLRRQNETLEAIAQTLFKHWFIDFEFPNADGKPYKSSGGAMIPSKLGEIPKGWNLGTLDDCLSLIIDYRGKTPLKLGSDWTSEGIPALSAKNIKNGKIIVENLVNFVDENLYKKWMKDELAKGDILLTSEAPLGEVYYLASNRKYVLSQRLFALRVNSDCSSPYVYFWLRSPQGQHLLNRRATGSTVQGIRQSELKKVEMIVPEETILKKASDLWMSILEKIESNYQQIQTLTKTRDALLPKLMSGKLRIKE